MYYTLFQRCNKIVVTEMTLIRRIVGKEIDIVIDYIYWFQSYDLVSVSINLIGIQRGDKT